MASVDFLALELRSAPITSLLSACTVGLLSATNEGDSGAGAAALVVSAAFGAAMGAAIHYLRVPSFIVTLAGMFLARGAASVLSPDSIGIKHDFYSTVSKSYILLPGGGRLRSVPTAPA